MAEQEQTLPAEKSFLERLGLVPKDLITIVLATLAFVLSATTMFFNFFYKIDHVSIIVPARPYLFLKGDMFEAASNIFTVVLINSGTQAVALTDIAFMFIQARQKDPCNVPGATLLNTDFEATVLKEKEISTKKIRLVGSSVDSLLRIRMKDDNFLFPVKPPAEPSKDGVHPMTICVQVGLTTASISKRAYAPIALLNFSKDSVIGDDVDPEGLRRPKILIKERIIGR
jgi:hypothetical protein